MEQPILNPPNPYVGTLRIFPGTLVKVAGRPRPNATRFAINFQTGPSLNPRDDLALHLSPCFTPPRVIRNSLVNGAWGVEEAWSNGAVVSPHAPFEIMILANDEQFNIAINGSHYCEFKHRIPYQQITHLTIDGDVDIERISVTSDSYRQQPSVYQTSVMPTAPSSAPSNPPYPTASGGMSMPTPSLYPILNPSQPPSSYPSMPPSMPTGPGPAPAPATYASGYPQAGPGPYPQPQVYPQPGAHNPYPQMPPTGGPMPAPSSYYQGGYPQQQPHGSQHQTQPGHSTSTPFGSLPIGGKALGTIAGLGLGAVAGAAALSAMNPMKAMKKVMKPKKMFKQKGWGRSSSSSSSSNSSCNSFSSNSS